MSKHTPGPWTVLPGNTVATIRAAIKKARGQS